MRSATSGRLSCLVHLPQQTLELTSFEDVLAVRSLRSVSSVSLRLPRLPHLFRWSIPVPVSVPVSVRDFPS